MIVLYLSGGLGNQLFNYAAARALSYKNDVPLLIDASLYADQWGSRATRPILLHMFPVRTKFRHMGPKLDRVSLYSRIIRRFREDLFAIRISRNDRFYNYFPEFNNFGGRVIMSGYYISPLFFSGLENIIRKELTLTDDFLSTTNDEIGTKVLDEILGSRWPVSVHVRRGDALSFCNPLLCLPNIEHYYLEAMKFISERREAACFWIFSDDPSWCQCFFGNTPYKTRVVSATDAANPRDLRDFYLMSRCYDQIICNSTYSWWAAWLNIRADKIVVAPNHWDAEDRTAIDEMILPEWTVLNF
jgi:hypothetical protein